MLVKKDNITICKISEDDIFSVRSSEVFKRCGEKLYIAEEPNGNQRILIKGKDGNFISNGSLRFFVDLGIHVSEYDSYTSFSEIPFTLKEV